MMGAVSARPTAQALARAWTAPDIDTLPPSVQERLARLAPDQRAAAMAPPGPVLCVAPAGSGKTTTLVARICWRIATGADPAACVPSPSTVGLPRSCASGWTRPWSRRASHAGHRPGAHVPCPWPPDPADSGVDVSRLADRGSEVIERLAGGPLPARHDARSSTTRSRA